MIGHSPSPHRSMPADDAVELAYVEMNRLGLRPVVGHLGQADHAIPVSRLYSGNRQVSVGYGKGGGSQAVASAHFEALERFYTSARISRRLAPGGSELRRAAQVATQDGLSADLVVQRWAREFPESTAACSRYQGERSSVRYPVFLTDPLYHRRPLDSDSTEPEPYRSLLRYSSSLGTASGATVGEAVLHGLCELVEHDSVSLALLRWFVAGRRNLDLVDRTTLPATLSRLLSEADAAAGVPVFLLDVTTDLEIPTYLAIAGDGAPQPSLCGAGASPVGRYAAERALQELIQCVALTDPSEARTALRRLEPWPVLRRCSLLPVGWLLGGSVRQVPLRNGDARSVDSSLDAVARLLRRSGVKWYVAELTGPESQVAVTACIVPGLERFSLVRLGVPVLPTGRGWSVWEAARAKGQPDQKARTR